MVKDIPPITPRKKTNTSKPVCMFGLDGKYLRTFKSAYYAMKEMGFKSKYGLMCVLAGKNKSAYGYQWRYLENTER